MNKENNLNSVIKKIFNPYGIPSLIFPTYRKILYGESVFFRSCVHEAAHVVVSKFVIGGGNPIYITVRPRLKKRLEGYTGLVRFDYKDQSQQSLKASLLTLQAPQPAERMVIGSIGPPQNYQHDTKLSRMVLKKLYPYLNEADEEKILKLYEEKAYAILEANKKPLYDLIDALKSKYTLNREEISQVLGDSTKRKATNLIKLNISN